MRVSLTVVTAALVFGLVFGLVACRPPAGQTPDVVASFYPLAMLAQRIGGPVAQGGPTVLDLTPPGVEPHDLELSPSNLAAIQSAPVVLEMGRGFQPAVEKAADGNERGMVIRVLDAVSPSSPSGDPSVLDPHIWLSPRRFADASSSIANAITTLDPSRSQQVGANMARTSVELSVLDRLYVKGLRTCDQRTIVTTHAAFGYLADDYDLKQVAIAGFSPDAEPNPGRLAELAQLVQDQGVTTIFTEPLVSSRVADTLARETGAHVAVLNPIEGLTPEQAAAGEDYFSLMRQNLAAIKEALGCH